MNQKKTTRIVILIISGVLVLLAVIALVFTGVIIPRQKYEKALALLDNGEYDAAYLILEN